MSEIDDRRERATEAAETADTGLTGEGYSWSAVVAGIETATRVRITPELLATMDPAIGNRETRLRAAFRAAGFEVEE